MNNVSWHTSPQQLKLDTLAIHIWRVSLSSSSEFSSAILSDEEKRWSERFVREEHRRQYCLSRIFLRKILARYLKIAPAAIVFLQGVHGKLSLVTSPIALQFNMTHSQDLALYAVTLNQEIGIDVEWINPDLAVSPLVSRFFTAQEQQFFSLLPAEQQKAAFYRLWTQKEAWLKATGIGLNGLEQMPKVPLNALTLNFAPTSEFIAALGVTIPDTLSPSMLRYYVLDGSATI